MRTEIVRCDECTAVIPDGSKALVVLVNEAIIAGNGLPTRQPFPVAMAMPIELCPSCSDKPLALRPYIERARRQAAEHAERVRRQIEEGGYGAALGGE